MAGLINTQRLPATNRLTQYTISPGKGHAVRRRFFLYRRPRHHSLHPELTVGQWVMGQMGQQIWMGHVGHKSVPVTH